MEYLAGHKENNMGTFTSSRRDFLKQSVYLGAAALATGPMSRFMAMAAPGSGMKLGLVTYLWGQSWDLPTIISNLEQTRILGVELRVEHAHAVSDKLTAAQRSDVKKRFADSPVELVGMGTNYDFHHTDPARLRASIEGAKAYLKLSHDCGGSGIKVKPNDLPKGVSEDKTTEQIGRSLNEIGKYAAELGQKVRLEVHGGCSRLPVIKKIMDVATHPSVGVCWNCNGQDLEGEGLVYNFNLVKDRFGDTQHVRELDGKGYPYQELMNLFVGMDYKGWILLECRTKPADYIAALNNQREVFGRMIANAQSVAPKSDGAVKITETGKTLRVELNGSLFTEYNYQDVPRPFYYPVIGATGDGVTRDWPMKDINSADAKDHVHHKGLWFTHGNINGQDFWAEGANSGKIVHDKFLEVKGGETGIIKSANKYVAKDGTVVCTDTRVNRFGTCDGGKFIDFEVTLHASHGKIVLGDTKEGSMAIRLTPTLRQDKQGHIVNSEGVKDGATWGKRAKWVDYYGPVKGKTTGVAIFDSPSNPKYPTWWHVRTYGLFAANPFGVHDFEKKPAGTGDITIESGESLTWKWRFYFHAGDDKQGKVAERYAKFITAR